MVAEADRLIASTAEEADAARRPLRRRPGAVRTVAPGRRPRPVHPRRRTAARGSRSGFDRDAADPAVRRPHPAAQGAGRAAARRRPAAATDVAPLQVVVVGAPERLRARPPATGSTELARELGLADIVRFVPARAAATPSPTTTAPPTSPSSPATTSRSGSSRSSRRPAGRRSSPRRSADCRPRWPTGRPACSSTGTIPTSGRRCSASLLRSPPSSLACAGHARAHAERFSWDRTTDALLAAYQRGGRRVDRCPRRACDRASRTRLGRRSGPRARVERDARRPLRRRAARREAAQDRVLAGRRHARARGPGVRHAQAGREPRGGLRVPAAAQRAHVRRLVGDRQHGRRLPGRPAAARRGHARRARPRARLPCSSTPTARSTRCSSSVSARRSGASGPGGSRTTSRSPTCRRSGTSRSDAD